MAAIGPLLTDSGREEWGEREGGVGEREIFTLHEAVTHFLF
jgi:hypothetical protein